MPPRDDAPPVASPAPRSGLLVMAIIVVTFAALSLFSNWQKRHIRDIEKVTVRPAPATLARPKTSATPADDQQ